MLDAQITFAIPADAKKLLLEVAETSYHAVGMGGRDSYHVLSSYGIQTLSVTVLSLNSSCKHYFSMVRTKLGW